MTSSNESLGVSAGKWAAVIVVNDGMVAARRDAERKKGMRIKLYATEAEAAKAAAIARLEKYPDDATEKMSAARAARTKLVQKKVLYQVPAEAVGQLGGRTSQAVEYWKEPPVAQMAQLTPTLTQSSRPQWARANGGGVDGDSILTIPCNAILAAVQRTGQRLRL